MLNYSGNNPTLVNQSTGWVVFTCCWLWVNYCTKEVKTNQLLKTMPDSAFLNTSALHSIWLWSYFNYSPNILAWLVIIDYSECCYTLNIQNNDHPGLQWYLLNVNIFGISYPGLNWYLSEKLYLTKREGAISSSIWSQSANKSSSPSQLFKAPTTHCLAQYTGQGWRL